MNTPSALNVIRNLITQSNVYINQTSAGVDGLLVLGIATWISKMLRIFGLEQQDTAKFGWEIGPSPGRGTSVSSPKYCVRLIVSLPLRTIPPFSHTSRRCRLSETMFEPLQRISPQI